ncbi:WD40 repeat domain-containing protein [Argonema antarcticum]|uniref:WD40 repeat domain-containing protein n=1 Tax=Argonema antarcticum TaxID=2942763 RepID=UPI002012736C|nr:WD40 repeat domain-containing protein [Argonema antarcticum]MCL1473617.1 WD40 repeat domain-containing protein [Argonema antarcticum A004/B2]
MTENYNQPRDYDAVLGGENPTPASGVVLGGIEGVRRRFTSAVVEHRIAAIKEALKYKKSGLEIVIQALLDESEMVKRSAYLLLRQHPNPEVRKALQSYNFYRFFDCLRTLKGGTEISISPDSETVAVLGSNKTIKVSELKTGELLYTVPKYSKCQQFFVIDSDKKTLIRSIHSSSDLVEVWYEGELQHTLYGHEDRLRAIAISPDKQTLATGGDDKTIKIWNLDNGKLIFNISHLLTWGTHKGAVLCLVFSPDGQTLASGGADQSIKLWNLRNRDKPRNLRVPCYGFFSMVISPDGKNLAAACYDNRIRLWHLDTGELIHTLKQLPLGANCLAFSPDGVTLASGGNYDGTIKFWNVQTGELLHTLTGHDNSVSCLAFSWDGQTLVSGSQDKTIKVWGIQ